MLTPEEEIASEISMARHHLDRAINGLRIQGDPLQAELSDIETVLSVKAWSYRQRYGLPINFQAVQKVVEVTPQI